MTHHRNDTDLVFEDDAEFFADPAFAAAYEDAESRHQLLTDLVRQRKAMRLTQKDVAAHMETSQSFVSEFENGGTDPHLSTLQRYARAVAAKLEVRITLPAECAWQPIETKARKQATKRTTRKRAAAKTSRGS